MKINYLTQAVSISLATLALTACGGGDDTPIYGVQDTPSPVVPTITPTETTPEVTPVTPAPTPATPNFVELAKQAGLTDANATIFAETVKNMTVGSQEYQNALAQAIEAQKSADAIKINSDAVSPTIVTANPFLNGIDVSKTPTVSSNHYIRQLGSNYERAANPRAIAGLGTVATEEPTNPWLSNYVLGFEAIRQADGTMKVVAIDSTGEMVVAAPTSDNPNQGKKMGILLGLNEGYSGDPAVTNALDERKTRLLADDNDTGKQEAWEIIQAYTKNPDAMPARKNSPYYTEEFNGLMYKTQRRNGDSMLYDYGTGYTADAAGRTEDNLGTGVKNSVRTLQEMNSQHHTRPRTELINNALLVAKNQNYNQYPRHANAANTTPFLTEPGIFISDGKTQPNRAGVSVATKQQNSFGDYTRSGLIVYNNDSKEVALEKGQKLGYKVPSWGREENVYMMNEKTGRLEVVNGVEPANLHNNISASQPATKEDRRQNPNPISSRASWLGARYGALEATLNGWYNHDGKVTTGAGVGKNSAFDYAVLVANNDSIRLFGKNMLGYDAGAEGEQKHNNTYIANYDELTGLMGIISADKLHHVQYGRLTNNIDLISKDSITDRTRILYRDFQSHGAPNTVDTYFYRGTGHTSLEQMATIKARGGSYQYFGHALTYNLGPYVNTAEIINNHSGGIPTAYGTQTQPIKWSSGSTIGNFVEAVFDASKSEVKGTIYNFLNQNVAQDENNFKKQTLASFEGNVFGNTVLGTANKTGTNEVGSLTASFFGEGAREIGGQISSISREQGYGDAKWGAVFGATRGTTTGNYSVIENK